MPSTPTAAQHLGNLEIVVGTGDRLAVRRFSVQERISDLFQVTVLAHGDDHAIDFDAVVGQQARFTLRAGKHARSWSGICNQARQVDVDDEGGVSAYEISIVPTLWLATQRRSYRVFEHVSEPDIALAILAEWSVNPRVNIVGIYPPRALRVQYAESDYAFLCRVLEEAGISFYFATVGAGDETALVLSDSPQAAPPREPSLFYRSELAATAGEHVARLRVHQQVSARPGAPVERICALETNAVDLAPGTVFRVEGHPRRELGLSGGLLVVEGSLSGTSSDGWTLRCDACTAEIPYRPPLRAPKPRTAGVESATVVAPRHDEGPVDDLGRVRVCFQWEREARIEEKSCCWIHVSQPIAGDGPGTVDLPRVGEGVHVDFLGGDPDRPVIVGRVHAGARDRATLVANDDELGVGGDRTQLVQRNEREVVGASRTRVVGAHERVDIGQDQHVHVGVDQTTTVGGARAVTVALASIENVGGDKALAVGGAYSVSIGGAMLTRVSGAQIEEVGLSKTVAAGERVEISCGEAKIVLESSGKITLEGTELALAASGAVDIAGSRIALEGAELGLVASNTAELTCGSAQINGDPVDLN